MIVLVMMMVMTITMTMMVMVRRKRQKTVVMVVVMRLVMMTDSTYSVSHLDDLHILHLTILSGKEVRK